MTLPCVLSHVVAQDQLNAFVYEEVRQHLLHERRMFCVLKPSGSTGDFITSLVYVRAALIQAGWQGSFNMTTNSDAAYFVMSHEVARALTSTVHCIIHFVDELKNAEALVLDIEQEVVKRWEQDQDGSDLVSLIRQKLPYIQGKAIRIDVHVALPNGDRIFYVSSS